MNLYTSNLMCLINMLIEHCLDKTDGHVVDCIFEYVDQKDILRKEVL